MCHRIKHSDLRAPLRHIAGFSRILANNFGPVMAVEAREYLQLIEDAVRRMGLLVEGLLSLAKLGQQPMKLCRTELNAIVDDVISILEPDCEGREVEWRIAKLPAGLRSYLNRPGFLKPIRQCDEVFPWSGQSRDRSRQHPATR